MTGSEKSSRTVRSPIRVAAVVVSTKGFTGQRSDRTGPPLSELVSSLQGVLEHQELIPDHYQTIVDTLRRLTDCRSYDILFTVGGTGCSIDDLTPEATRAVVDREIPGIAEEMRLISRKYTPYAALSRATAGIRQTTLIVNFPGKPASIQQIGAELAPLLEHLVDLLRSPAGSGHLHGQEQ